MRKFIVCMAILVVLLGIFTPKVKQEKPQQPQQPKPQKIKSVGMVREAHYTNVSIPVPVEKQMIMVRVHPQFEQK